MRVNMKKNHTLSATSAGTRNPMPAARGKMFADHISMLPRGVPYSTESMGRLGSQPASLPAMTGAAWMNAKSAVSTNPTRKALSRTSGGSSASLPLPSVSSRGTRASGKMSRSDSTHCLRNIPPRNNVAR